MQHLDAAGFPVPKVYDADGSDLVMERLDGRDLLADLGRRPWLARTARPHARRDAQPAAPDHCAARTSRQPLGPGDKVLHLDLHPGNVMMTRRGPVVIDWSNAGGRRRPAPMSRWRT